MPEPEYVWLPREDILHFEEIERWSTSSLDLGVDKVRLTGGEPLLRRDLPDLVARLASRPAIRDLAMTTNGVLLAPTCRRAARRRAASAHGQPRHAAAAALSRPHPLRRARSRPRGHRRRRPALPRPQARHRRHPRRQRRRAGRPDRVRPRGYGAEVRFIEYMDVGGATHWSMARVVLARARCSTRWRATTVRSRRSTKHLRRRPIAIGCPTARSSASSRRPREPFCQDCDRSRLTADGMWYLCLYASRGADLRGALRRGATPVELAAADSRRRGKDAAIAAPKTGSPRATARRSSRSIRCRRDPHLEMHTRGG